MVDRNVARTSDVSALLPSTKRIKIECSTERMHERTEENGKENIGKAISIIHVLKEGKASATYAQNINTYPPSTVVSMAIKVPILFHN